MIQVENLTKVFGSIPVLGDVSFSVHGGEVVGLLGPNGAGKTTAMRILTGAIPPSSGTVRVAGHDVTQAPLEVKRRVGYLPEVPPVYPEMRVRSYLRFVAELKGVPKARRRERVEWALGQCSLENRADQPIEQLSKGHRQRVGLAQATLHDPDLLVLDEPTSGLDPRQIIEVRDLIRELSGEHTVVLSSHILSEIAASCERLIVMSQGRVVASDSVQRLSERFIGVGKVRLLARGPLDALHDAVRAVDGVDGLTDHQDPATGAWRLEITGPPDSELRPRIAAAVVEAGHELLALEHEELSLEAIFLRLTEDDEVAADDGTDDDASREAA